MESQALNKQINDTSQVLRPLDNDRFWIVLALLVGIGLRGYFLAQPIRYDESFTFLNFINNEFKYLFYYPLPNNHVLHSILTKVSTIIWGVSPVPIRLTAFVAGTALIPVVFTICRLLGQSGILASTAIAISPYLVLYSTNARGYTLLVLFTLILALIGIKIADNPSIQKAFNFSLIASLGMLSIPSMLFPMVGIYLWVLLLLLIKRHDQKEIFFMFLIPSALLTCIITTLFYMPVIFYNGIESIVANRFVISRPWDEFVGQIYPHFKQTFVDFTRDIPIVILLVTIILVAIGMGSSFKQRNWHIVFILPSIILALLLIFLIKQAIPFSRTWIYIIPIVVIVADSGFTYVTTIVSHRIRLLLKASVFGISIFIAISLMSKNVIMYYPDTGVFAEAEIVAKYLKSRMKTNDLIHVNTPEDWPLYYYLWYHNVAKIKANSDAKQEFFVIKKNNYASMGMDNRQYVKLLDMDGFALFQSLSTNAD